MLTSSNGGFLLSFLFFFFFIILLLPWGYLCLLRVEFQPVFASLTLPSFRFCLARHSDWRFRIFGHSGKTAAITDLDEVSKSQRRTFLFSLTSLSFFTDFFRSVIPSPVVHQPLIRSAKLERIIAKTSAKETCPVCCVLIANENDLPSQTMDRVLVITGAVRYGSSDDFGRRQRSHSMARLFWTQRTQKTTK